MISTTTLKTHSLLDESATDVGLAGGKGANLAKLAQAGFHVPIARIIGVDIYQQWLAQLSGFLGQSLSIHDAVRLERECRDLREQLSKLAMPASTECMLRQELAQLCNKGPVSVRSSATLEDMHGASFAGQHDTFLGVQGIDSVIARIVDCYVSVWEDRAVKYRAEQGFNPDAISMAVVVQQMVDADVAGVAFSAHPLTGQIEHVLVNSAYGLGETVVSGQGEVDQFTIDGCNKIISQHIGQKQEALVLQKSGAHACSVDVHKQDSTSLSGEQVVQVATLARKAQQHFGFPQDIEWAFDKTGLHLLQSRPISELPARWTRQESAERFPSPVTPLTWDFTTGGFHESLAYSLNLMGLPAFNGRWFERFDGYIYGNQTAVELYTAGQQIEFESLPQLEARLPHFRQSYTWVQELPALWACNLDRFLLRLGALSATDLTTLTNQALWRHIDKLEQTGNAYFLPNIAISITQGLLHRTLYKLVAMVSGEHAPLVYDDLTCHCDTKTARVNRDLHALYKLMMQQPELVELIQKANRKSVFLSGALDAYPTFEAGFSEFIDNHGHREVDFDAYHATWNRAPWVVLENLRLMSLQPEIPDPCLRDAHLRSRQHRAEIEFLGLLPTSLTGFAKELIHLSRTYTALDDLEHYHTTRLSVPFRDALLELGRRQTHADVIEEDDDLFFLTQRQLEDFIEGRLAASKLKALIAEAKLAYRTQQSTEPLYEYGNSVISASTDNGSFLCGLPGSPGAANGKTCVIRGVEDFASFEPGSVLVARTTNPAWTPLFYAASAVVTESGGPLSHGAVTAREIGIPAVVAARGAMQTLGDGVQVNVDGARGTVELVG